METEFYNLLKKSVNDDVALVKVLETIMPLINANSFDDDNKYIEDLKSELIYTAIKIIRKKEIYKKIEKKLKSLS